MKYYDIKRKLGKHFWDFLILALAAIGIYKGVKGFSEISPAYSSDWYNLYESSRMLLLNRQIDPKDLNDHLWWASWLTLAAFLLFSGRLFIRLFAPRMYRWYYFTFYGRNHIIICGLNELTMSLINRCSEKRVVVITANKNNSYLEGLNKRNILVIEGNPNDKEVLKQVKLHTAAKVHILKRDDRINVEIAYKIYELVRNKPRNTHPLKCFVMVQDRELKNVLEVSPLFDEGGENYKGQIVFDGILFNIAESGIHYGINKRIDIIFGEQVDSSPEFLIIGLNKDSEEVILNLAHGLTTKREKIGFTVIERDEYKQECFRIKYPYLEDFVRIEYRSIEKSYHDAPEEALKTVREEIERFSSIFICFDSGVDNIKAACSFSRTIRKDHPAVITFCNHPESISEIMNIRKIGRSNFFETHNIHIINNFEETFDYIFELDQHIEECAEAIHNHWAERSAFASSYQELPDEQLRQSNRNLVIDNFYKMYLLGGIQLRNCKEPERKPLISDDIKEIMAEMEHRRWVIEKFRRGWQPGSSRQNKYKIHPDILPWDELDAPAAQINRDFVYFMIELLTKHYKNER